jgi:ADP-ribosyl-[dinitrogen reductase] hydrolase
MSLQDRFEGVLLGTALGDALGLPAEGLSREEIGLRFGTMDRFRLVGRRGFVSDDTEQSALVATALARSGNWDDAVRAFRRSLLGWFARLPFGVGLTTLRACLRIAFGMERSGVHGAGNGAAMRSAIIGAYFFDDARMRSVYARAFAEVTHTDPRAVDAAIFTSELSALSIGSPDRRTSFGAACKVVTDRALSAALERASSLAEERADIARAAIEIGTSGYSLHSVPFATFVFLRFGHDPMLAIREAVLAGGDTDTNAAIVGAFMGALHGARALPADLIDELDDGPFGPTHLRNLAAALDAARSGTLRAVPFSALHALLRNIALFPVILIHGFSRILPSALWRMGR